MVIPYTDLKKYEFSLSDIKIFRQEPSYRILVQKNRLCNGFMYVLEGSCRYSFEGGEFDAKEGSLLYLPYGSVHTLSITTENFKFYRVDFTAKIGEEIALFSEKPLKITDCLSHECVTLLNELESDYGISDDSIARMEKLCKFLSHLERIVTNQNSSRLMPAINFLQENAIKKVDCSQLAELCFLGSSRFYDLFKAEFGMTPLEYRDRLLIRRAAVMLEAGDVSVKEAAFAIGFENTAYFSRFFKKHTGLPPNEYAKNKTHPAF